ncbi:MAG: heavy-metal-associated domain-containing protein [Paenibacillaceae bacterium]|uniref:Heavy-metal-associated domain-containing protein n=1 Tax=Paenibacillus mellifer TaxID=2937794 RepID=A0A9X2BNZ1_9BACL|nr:heavy-metal-associated domain-containing protein [Paenibacillus mellifer]MBW4839370.1 heavy-metal-associated domain-containing protein [Paenibacillaceae bacterium]MCK8486588.1 heavy-metal-associated domain-containing protein [Paenibacillus mellifer]
MINVKWKVEELTCPSCIKKIETVLTKQPGVQEAKVLFHSSQVKVAFDENQVQEEQLRNAMAKLGYPVVAGGGRGDGQTS